MLLLKNSLGVQGMYLYQKGFEVSTKQDVEPIKKELEKRFETVGSCSLEADETSIRKTTNELIDQSAMYVVAAWESLPDLIGRVKIQKPLPVREEKTVVVRIVEGVPELKDIYTLKRFSEVLSPNYAFLITKKPFDEQTSDYLENHPHILHFLRKESGALAAGIPIVLMTWDSEGNLVINHSVGSKDPFDPKHMWQ